jgi:hypothetical protein
MGITWNFYEGWTTELATSMELAESIYEVWTYDVSSQWHKTKVLIGGNPTKKNQICFLFSYLLCFAFYFIFFILWYFFSFISTLRKMLCLKCGGIKRILVFFVVFQKKKVLSFIFWTLIGLWEYKYYVWELVKIDRWKYKLNEWVCMQV